MKLYQSDKNLLTHFREFFAFSFIVPTTHIAQHAHATFASGFPAIASQMLHINVIVMHDQFTKSHILFMSSPLQIIPNDILSMRSKARQMQTTCQRTKFLPQAPLMLLSSLALLVIRFAFSEPAFFCQPEASCIMLAFSAILNLFMCHLCVSFR